MNTILSGKLKNKELARVMTSGKIYLQCVPYKCNTNTEPILLIWMNVNTKATSLDQSQCHLRYPTVYLPVTNIKVDWYGFPQVAICSWLGRTLFLSVPPFVPIRADLCFHPCRPLFLFVPPFIPDGVAFCSCLQYWNSWYSLALCSS